MSSFNRLEPLFMVIIIFKLLIIPEKVGTLLDLWFISTQKYTLWDGGINTVNIHRLNLAWSAFAW